VSFVERQIAHVWAGSMAASCLLYAVEALLEMPVLALSPVLGLIAGMVFLVKAGILAGAFYIQAVVLFGTALVMAIIRQSDWPDFSISLFGIVAGTSFFVPGLKYHRQLGRRAPARRDPS
jgi:serine/threonine-protein kinase